MSEELEFYKSKFDGTTIDKRLGMIGDSYSELLKNLGLQYYTNSNLLDNWFFGRPVNQRGQTSYTYTPTSSYTIDRWRADGNGTIMLKDGYIDVFNNNSWCSVMQYIDNPKYFAGKTLTASMLRRDENPLKLLLYVDGKSLGEVLKTDKLVSTTVTLPDNVSSLAILFGADANKTSSILAAKLELGDQQTLAHKENGVWVLNEVPDYGEQLRRCQRYLFSARGTTNYVCVGSGYISADGTEAVIVVPTPVSLRATPVCMVNGILHVDTSYGEGVTVNNVSLLNVGNGSVGIRMKITGSATPKSPCFMWIDINNNLLFSADL